MLLVYPKRYRSPDDDGAPVDYTYADSVAEGERRRQSEPIHRTKEDGTTVSAVYPRPRSNAFTQTPAYTPKAPDTLQAAQTRYAASHGAAQAEPPTAAPKAEVPGRNFRRAAHYAEQREAPQSDTPSRQNPFQNPENNSREGAPASGRTHNAAPSSRQMPDWLRAAQQNQTPYHPNPTPSGRPTQFNHPNPLDDSNAGYPPELLNDQRLEREAAGNAQGVGHRSHGAQAAVSNLRRTYSEPDGNHRMPPRESNRPYHSEESGSSPYSVTQEPRRTARRRNDDEEPGEDTEESEERKTVKIPALGIAVFVAALLLVGLWIGQVTFGNLKTGVLAARAETVQKLADTHPFQYRELIEREATANNLNPAFIAAIIFNESSFNPKAESAVGARGLMQMMPDTAEWVHGKIDANTEYSFDLMYDPDANVKYACWYLAYLGNYFHNDPVLVAAAFHAGQTTVKNWLNDSRYSMDSQTIELKNMAEGPTKNYATRVMNSYAIYRRLYYEGGLPAASTNAA